jgi:hypothetical protein
LYLLYLDESGDPNGWQSQTNFIIGGIAVFEGQIAKLTQQVDAVQKKYFPSISIQLNLHAHEINAGVGQFKSLGSADQQNLLRDVYNVIGSGRYPNFAIFSTIMDISQVTNSNQAVFDTFQEVCQRFSYMLTRFQPPQKGLLIIDQAHEAQYREMLREFQTTGTKYGYTHNIIDVPYFGRAVHTRMIQLADFITYAAFQYYEHNDKTFFDVIKARFDRRGPTYPPDALKHLIKTRCTCEACYWR